MTVSNDTVKVSGTGNGSATLFSFAPIVIFKTTEMVVTLVTIATGAETLLVEGTGDSAYAVVPATGAYPSATGLTGSIRYPEDAVTPIDSTQKLVMQRKLLLEQLTDLENQGTYFPDILETQIDKNVMLSIQQQEEIDRALKIPIGAPNAFVNSIPALVGNRFIRTKSDLTGWELVALTGTGTAIASDATPQETTITAVGVAGVSPDFSRADHEHRVNDYVKVAADVHNKLNFI